MAISIKKLKEENGTSKYVVKGASPAFINAVRRSMMLHMPCLAIEDVSIYENDSVMFDEFLAHRLGMLPIKMDSKGYKLKDKVKMVLEKEGPCTVYSKDIKSTDPKIEVTDKNIPITKLSKGQKLKLEMQAVVLSGKEHAKWQPAVVGYREMPSLDVSKECNECGDCVKICPVNILEIKSRKVAMTKQEECSLCGACVDTCKKEALKLQFDGSTFVFIIEPITGMNAKEVVGGAVKALLEKSKEYSKALQKIK
jgi:DNA-directed RNA polymerase subunit D